jgi:SAM-dependent methyltransferase
MKDSKEEHGTADSFRLKWEKTPDLCFEETLDENSEIFNWILGRNGFKNSNAFSRYLADKKRILDAGCGNGRVTALLRKYSKPDTTIVGIDLVSHEIARKNLMNESNVSFYKKDILDDVSELGQFDYIYCQEVLHHTENPRKAFENLCSLLSPKGEISIYVYKKKAPVREFVDDFIREKISRLSYDDAFRVCKQITELGKTLSELKLNVEFPSINVLEIKGGEYDIQRFFYHFFMKCFWNSEMSFEHNAVINYDWYHPQLCSRHTLKEVRQWFSDSALSIKHEHVDFYGITMSGRKEPNR